MLMKIEIWMHFSFRNSFSSTSCIITILPSAAAITTFSSITATLLGHLKKRKMRKNTIAPIAVAILEVIPHPHRKNIPRTINAIIPNDFRITPYPSL
jgi:hypothetical protein